MNIVKEIKDGNKLEMHRERTCQFCGEPIVKKNILFRLRGQYFCSTKCARINNRILHIYSGMFVLISSIVVMVIVSFDTYYLALILLLPLILGLAILLLGIISIKDYREMIRNSQEDDEETSIDDEEVINELVLKYFLRLNNYVSAIGSSVCAICKIKLDTLEEYYQCPYCQSRFHADHLREWLKIKNECPVCKRICLD
ncbi:MAG: RING finger domain-containing protein [Candidatus Thorarchaeota archaeon]